MERTIDNLIEYFESPVLTVIHIGKKEKEQTIQLLKEHKTMESILRGECRYCEHGRKYKEHFEGVYDENDRLIVCIIGKHDEHTIATAKRMKDCEEWKLKQNLEQ